MKDEKKAKPFASKAQATHVYNAYKKGEIGYEEMMKAVHATDFQKIPERVTPKVDKKTDVAIKGLI